MTDGPEWFAPKRYGYGAGLPISWQGWALSAAFLAIVVGIGMTADERNPIPSLAVIIPVTALFLVISARTTRGGWRWRWGEED